MVGRGGQAVQEAALRQNGGAAADRRHDAHCLVHRAHPVEQRRNPFRIRLIVEQLPDSPATGRHQDVERLLERLREVSVRHGRGTVNAFHLRDLPGDQHGFERVWRRGRIVLAEEARDGKGFGKAENVDRLETVKDQDADPLGRRKLWFIRNPIPPVPIGLRSRAGFLSLLV
jgi:hypothetical protein